MPLARQQAREHVLGETVGLGFSAGAEAGALQGAHTLGVKQSLCLFELSRGDDNQVPFRLLDADRFQRGHVEYGREVPFCFGFGYSPHSLILQQLQNRRTLAIAPQRPGWLSAPLRTHLREATGPAPPARWPTSPEPSRSGPAWRCRGSPILADTRRRAGGSGGQRSPPTAGGPRPGRGPRRD